MNRKLLALVVAGVVTLLAAPAAAEPLPLPEVIPVTESVTLRSDAGLELRVPPGFYVPAPAWAALDLELKRSQTAETRLQAENQSLRASAKDDSGPGWGSVIAIGSALAAGMIAGAWAY